MFINKELLPFPRGDDIEIAIYTSTKLQPHLEQIIFVWRGFKFGLSERWFYFLYGGNSDIVNINWRLLKTLFSITKGSISSNLGTIKAFLRKEDVLFLVSIDKLVGQIVEIVISSIYNCGDTAICITLQRLLVSYKITILNSWGFFHGKTNITLILNEIFIRNTVYYQFS